MVVNERGFLIDATTGDVRSKYTFEVVFKNHEMTGRTRCDLPLPYRLENYNFNPHQCFGNFDFDDKRNPIILKDKNGIRIDKNLRHVNSVGWLIDRHENIIDSQGKIKLIKEMLSEKGEIPKLFNYLGETYKIRNVMGIFERDRNSKDIILCYNPSKKF